MFGKKLKTDYGSLNLEMALIIGLVVLAVVGSLTLVGEGISDLYLKGSELEGSGPVGGLTVSVEDDGGSPVADATVTAATTDLSFSATDVTEADGLATFTEVPVGEVNVTIEGDGLETETFTVEVEEGVTLTENKVITYTLVESPVTDFIWSTSGGEATVVRYIGNSPNVVVPSTYMGLPVTKMFNGSWTSGTFYDKGEIVETVVLPSSITNIGDYAFRGCDSLTSVVIPNSVTTIGNNAFYDCFNLTSITIPNSVITIGNAAFVGCSGLASVVIPNSVTTIGNVAFGNCFSLASITIPNSVTSIGDAAFAGCYVLASVVIPNSVTRIGDYTFTSCYSLTSVVIPNSVTNIGGGAFSNCSKLAVAYILGTPTIASGAFPTSTSGSATSIANPSGTYYGTTYTRWYTNAARTTERTTWPMNRTSTAATTVLWGSP